MAFFYVLEDGVYVPTTELAQSYAALNFKQENSLGIGTTSIIPISNPDNPNWIADIKSRDFWGYTEDGEENLYRFTKIGIGTDIINSTLDISGTLRATEQVNFQGDLNVVGITTFQNFVGFETNIRDSNFEDGVNLGIGKTDYRLASYPGIGVSWRPPGVETENTIWVTKDGNDNNTGFLEGDAKASVGAAATVAQPGDTIFIRAGEYTENNPIGLRSDVTVTGQDIRLVKLIPQNKGKDFFHVRRGCLIENLSFTCESDGAGGFVDNPGGAAVAFPPRDGSKIAVSGFIELGPTDEGPSGRWRSPYIRNCTNFMPKSIGMKIDGDDAVATVPGSGADLKSMVCDSFTQYNEAGIGVSITNNGYAQLVSIFTINSDIGIYCDTGGSCDLTNSNTSFGNFGLYAVGLGRTEFEGSTSVATADETDRVQVTISTPDPGGGFKRPYDGQALFFKIPIGGVPLTDPLVLVQSVSITNPDGYGSPGQFSPSAPPSVGIIDIATGQPFPLGPEGIIAEFSPTIDEFTGKITSIDVVNSGRNYLPSQVATLRIEINGTTISDSDIQVNTDPIYYTVSESTEPDGSGNCIITFNEFIPYLIDAGVNFDLKRISKILTSSHSFEYVGSGTSINTVTPLQGAVPIKENEIVQLAGAQIPFTSTDQKGNFDIGEGFQINQPTSTIRGRAFSKAIQAELTPLILALGR
jgi:hypothetical protein